MFASRPPAGMPVLTPGKHRGPKSGACFMEFASYLAGERWSDHPECTHPLLAALARDVNDVIDDAHRAELVPLIPEVVGLDGDEPIVHVAIASRAAGAALPAVAMDCQRSLATGLLVCRATAEWLAHPATPGIIARIDAVLDLVPGERQWAIQRQKAMGTAAQRVDLKAFRKRSAPRIVHLAVGGLTRAVIMDADDRLVALLRETIAEVRALTTPTPTSRPTAPATAGRAGSDATWRSAALPR